MDEVRGKPVEFHQGRNAGPVPAGDGSQRVSTHDRMADPTFGLLPPGRGIRQLRPEPLDGVAREQQPVRAVGAGGPTLEPRVEHVELVEGDAGEVRRRPQIDLAVELDLPEGYAVGDRRKDDAIPARVRNDGGDAEQAGQMGARFAGQLQRPDVRRLPPRAVPFHLAPDVALAPVVGGEREQPVPFEVLGELREVVERSAGGGDDVAAPVVPPVLLQSVDPSGRRDELPQPRRSRRRFHEGPESALDDRQQCELDGQASPLDLPHDVRQVRPGPPYRMVEILPVLPVPADLAYDPRVHPVRR